MDLTRLASLPEDDLRALARRFSIDGVDELDRYELIEAIRKKTRPTGPFARARELASSAIELARALAAIAAPPTPVRRSLQVTVPAPESERPTSSPTAPAPPPPQRASDVVQSPPPAGAHMPAPPAPLSQSDRVLLAREPIQTRTMARLLAQQGHGRRAAAIYTKLLQRHPNDDALRREIEQARDTPDRPVSERSDDDEEPDEVVSVRADDDRFVLAWRVGGEAVARARRLLGSDGTIARRTVVVRPDAQTIVRSEEHTMPASAEGAAIIEGVKAGARAIVAIGVLDGERFVSIAHHAVRT
jgi:hypothetical protein